MDERRVNIIAAISVITLIILIVVARVTLKLSKAFFLIFGAGVAVILAVFAYVLVSISYNRRRRLLESQLKSQGQELRIEYSFLRKVAGVPIKFRYKELEEATDGFQALIGKGASASVFKGILNDGTSVAVKQIDAEERGEKQFSTTAPGLRVWWMPMLVSSTIKIDDCLEPHIYLKEHQIFYLVYINIKILYDIII